MHIYAKRQREFSDPDEWLCYSCYPDPVFEDVKASRLIRQAPFNGLADDFPHTEAIVLGSERNKSLFTPRRFALAFTSIPNAQWRKQQPEISSHKVRSSNEWRMNFRYVGESTWFFFIAKGSTVHVLPGGGWLIAYSERSLQKRLAI